MTKKQKEQILAKFEKSYTNCLAENTLKIYLGTLRRILSGEYQASSKTTWKRGKIVVQKCSAIGIDLAVLVGFHLPKFAKRGDRVKEEIEDKHLTSEQVETILSSMKDSEPQQELKRACEISYSSGLRLSEVLRLERKDFTIREDLDIIVVSVKGKGGKSLKVYLPMRFRVEVEAWKSFSIDANYVKTTIKRLASRIGIRFSFHSFRHSYALKMLRGGTSIADVQKILGHANLATTAIYLRVLEDTSIIEKVRKILG